MNKDVLIRAALDAGATKAAVIDQSQIVYSRTFRDMCALNSCGMYGRCYMCPPDVGPIDELMAAAQAYPRALLYQTINGLEDSFDIEGMQEAKKRHNQLSQRLRDVLDGVLAPGALHLSGGGCGVCGVCAKRDGQPCRYPDRAMASLEAYGMDVYNTTSSTELKYINGQNTVTYFGMVLFHDECSED